LLIAEPLQKAIDELSKLPAIGKKTAQRLALHILKSDEETVRSLINSLIVLKEKIRFVLNVLISRSMKNVMFVQIIKEIDQ